MSKFDSAIESAKTQMKKQKISCDEKLLTAVAKSLGPSLYNRDSSTVASSSKKELQTIRKNFVEKKLGCKEEAKVDKAMDAAINKIGKSNRHKNRAVFYYLLVKELGKQKEFLKKAG